MTKMKLLSTVALTLVISSCSKPAGEGGQATMKGRIWVENYNTLDLTGATTVINYTLLSEYAGTDEDVYIIYGDDVSYGKKVKSGPDGVFEFKYLRKGDYKIYVQSKDTSRAYLLGTISGIRTVSTNVTISDKKETIETENLVIYK